MKKFKVIATREDEYEIEVDETYWTPEILEDWSKTFFPTDEGLSQFVGYISSNLLHGDPQDFYEGFGHFKCLRGWYDNSQIKIFDYSKIPIKEVQYCPGVTVRILEHASCNSHEVYDMDTEDTYYY